jgi:acetoin utilization deacetylase AcuC-like enzyme
VTLKDVQRVHFCVPDVWTVTTESHFISAGGAKTIGMAVMEKQIERGFALVRPPGHHAMRVVHGARGFCNINIEAVMIEYLRRAYGVDRVAIVDTDCHHGDGSQDIYWHDPNTLFISVHQDGRTLYPGTGFINELGGPNAVGTTLNLPLPPNTSEEGFLHVLDHVILPVLEEFKPDLVVNSAGQDNHYTDPITNMNFCAQGYAALTERLKPDIAVLEGGYSIEGALPYVNVGIILAMAGLDYSRVKEPGFDAACIRQSAATTETIEKIGEAVLARWHARKDIQYRMREGRKVIDRSRNIFYDTDMIREQQKERVRVCDDCAGVLRIDSMSDTSGHRILAVHIPRRACPACRAMGEEWFEKADRVTYSIAYLQDRTTDRFVVKERK